MKAPSKCPVCGERKKWVRVDKHKGGSPTGALAGAVAGGLKGGVVGAVAGGLIGSALGRGKKFEDYVCGSCGFAHTYEA